MPAIFIGTAAYIAILNYLYPMTEEERVRLAQLRQGYGLQDGKRLPMNMTKAPLDMRKQMVRAPLAPRAPDLNDDGFIDLSHLDQAPTLEDGIPLKDLKEPVLEDRTPESSK